MKLTTSALAQFVLTCHSIGSAQTVQKKSLRWTEQREWSLQRWPRREAKMRRRSYRRGRRGGQIMKGGVQNENPRTIACSGGHPVSQINCRNRAPSPVTGYQFSAWRCDWRNGLKSFSGMPALRWTRSLASGRIRGHDKKRRTSEKPRTASCATPRMSNTAALIWTYPVLCASPSSLHRSRAQTDSLTERESLSPSIPQDRLSERSETSPTNWLAHWAWVVESFDSSG